MNENLIYNLIKIALLDTGYLDFYLNDGDIYTLDKNDNIHLEKDEITVYKLNSQRTIKFDFINKIT